MTAMTVDVEDGDERPPTAARLRRLPRRKLEKCQYHRVAHEFQQPAYPQGELSAHEGALLMPKESSSGVCL